MQQLSFNFSAPALPVADPRYPAFDRMHEGPLTAHELACLAAHGYTLVEVDATGACFIFKGERCDRGNDYWRSEIDVLYLLAKQRGAV